MNASPECLVGLDCQPHNHENQISGANGESTSTVLGKTEAEIAGSTIISSIKDIQNSHRDRQEHPVKLEEVTGENHSGKNHSKEEFAKRNHNSENHPDNLLSNVHCVSQTEENGPSVSSDENGEKETEVHKKESSNENTSNSDSVQGPKVIDKSDEVPLHERLGITNTQLNFLRNMAIEYYFGVVVVKKKKIEKKFACDVCGKVLRNNTNLKRHMQCHNPVKAYNCEICGKDFSDKYYFKLHYKRHSGNFPYQCGICQRPFLQKCTLDEHLRRHTGERPYKCQYCDKTFSTNGIMLEHQRTHTGEKPYKCKLCDKAFTQGNTLRQHMSVHSNETDHVNCDLCGKTFSCKSYLKIHMKVHQKGDPLYCSVCQKVFNCPRSLTRHMRVHTGEKPFRCQICGRQFSQKSNLYKHRKVHKDKPAVEIEMANEGSDTQDCNEDESIDGNSMPSESPLIANVKQEQGDTPKEDEIVNQSTLTSETQCETADTNETAQESTTIKIKQEPPDGCENNLKNGYQDSLDDMSLEKGSSQADTTNDNLSPNRIHSSKKYFDTNDVANNINVESQTIQPLLCGICNVVFYKSEHMQSHLKCHEANYFKKLFVCKVCYQSFPNKLLLTAHSKSHGLPKTSEKTCNICQQNFTSKKQLTTHRNKIHPLKISNKNMSRKTGEQVEAKYLTNDRKVSIDQVDVNNDQLVDESYNVTAYTNDRLHVYLQPTGESREMESKVLQIHELTNTTEVAVQACIETESVSAPWNSNILDIRLKHESGISNSGVTSTSFNSDNVNHNTILGALDGPHDNSLRKMNKLEELLRAPLSAFPQFPKFE